MRFDRDIEVRFRHRLLIGRGVFDEGNDDLAEVLAEGGTGPARVLFCVDTQVARANPDLVKRIHAWEQRHRAMVEPCGQVHAVPGGEFCKTNREVLYALLSRIHRASLDRQSYIVVVGGGAVLDCVGMAAALAHRGVRLIRIPTTTLAQADSAVGVKNAINGFEQKNYLGTFAVPWAVIHDEALLESLPAPAWCEGFSEAVKVALLKDQGLFDRICRDAGAIGRVGSEAGLQVLRRSAVLHLDHIAHGGDPFEMHSARPLDFGHWAAHRIESLSDYRWSHGRAVAVGLMIDLHYGRLTGLTDPACVEQAGEALAELGLVARAAAGGRDAGRGSRLRSGGAGLESFSTAQLLEGIEHFRAHLGGRLSLTMVCHPGRSVQIDEVDTDRMEEAIDLVCRPERIAGRR